ncbi:hypothetical protein [Herbaspirillum sp. 1130]|uniref:hypothetical protein n=1 Tax=Herbaspirillum sp. 1130 TaxID=2806562 RepID=UPI001AEA40F3|nr:hypothetical protein [Herbaspirillum sp. 1130]MBP1312811.1 hypothetical protein [Herbaspirillum sp. 1130]
MSPKGKILPVEVRQEPKILANVEPHPQTLANDFPREVNRHVRYISPWDSNQVTIDTSASTELGKYFQTFDIDKMTLSCDRRSGGIYDGIVPLTHFPNLVEAMKRAINLMCLKHNEGALSVNAPGNVRIIQNVFSWLVSRGIYWLREAEISDLEQLLDEVAQSTWAGVTKLDEKLQNLMSRLKENPVLAHEFTNNSNAPTFTISRAKLEAAVGHPFDHRAVPRWFIEELSALVGNTREIAQKKYEVKPTFGAVRVAALAINILENLRGEIDGFQFIPFPSAHKATNDRKKNENAKQTPNIDPSDSIKLIKEQLAWLFDYGPKVASALTEVRLLIDKGEFESFATQYRDAKIRFTIRDRIQTLINRGELPGDGNGLKADDYITYVEMTMTACGNVIGVNHARRAKEIYGGYRISYGTYYGCVQPIDAVTKSFTSEFWVSKGEKAWRNFPANGLVADAVALLEDFYWVFRKKDEEIPVTSDRRVLREMKLFTRRYLTSSGLLSDEKTLIDHSGSTKHLFVRAGVDLAKWKGSASPFRRMYVQLSLRRYDMPELPAAARQLGHQGYPQLLHYASDKHARAAGESVIEIHSRNLDADSRDLLKSIQEEGATYLSELIQKLFRGNRTGGIFPKRVIKLAQRLSSVANFSVLSVKEKSDVLAERLTKQGYAVSPMPHVACTAGTAKHASASAKCAKNGALQRQNSSPSVCSGCPQSWTTENYQRNILEEAENMRAEAALPTTPSAVALGLEREADEYLQLYEKDCAISEENRNLMESYLQHFNMELGVDD